VALCFRCHGISGIWAIFIFPPNRTLFTAVCVCVCVERERERERARERKRERER
jgi:hypothetical protein